MGNSKKTINKSSSANTLKSGGETSAFNAMLIIAATVIAVAIIVACVFAVAGGIKEKMAAPGDLVAMESEHFEVTNGMLSYFLYSDYYSALSDTNTYYSLYLSGFDASKSLKNQEYTAEGENSGLTWFDYFMSNTANNVTTYLLFAEKAYEAGIKEIDEKDLAEIDKSIESFKEGAESIGLSLEDYIEFMYGDGTTEQDIREAMEFQLLAMKQYQNDYDSFEYDITACEEKYDAAPTDYNYSDYRTFTFYAKYPDDEEDTEGREAAEIIAKQLADELKACATEEEFESYVYNYLVGENALIEDEEEKNTDEELTDEAAATLVERAAYTTGNDYADWAYVEGRAAGDNTVIDNEDGSYTVYYMVRPQYRLDYNTKNVRHILINSANYDSDEEALAKAEEVLELYNSGATKGEDAFDALAEEYNEDSASLYENIMLDQMVEEFESWCFDEARVAGDCEIVKSTYGYHIIYFVGDGDIAWKAEVEADLIAEAFQNLITEYDETYEVSFDRDIMYKLSGLTAYSKDADTKAPETTDEPEDTSDDTAEDTANDTADTSDTADTADTSDTSDTADTADAAA
ncbi:MAG: peptidylprolyl isomerase [Clostridia bacterium]|nr:peptidylprolyl isomerase [Clostridia bacterium]